MSNLINIKIDVTKIDKARLFQGKNGAKYLDAVAIPTSNSQYGDTHMIVQSVSKEEREQGIRGEILGNATEREQQRDRRPQDPPANTGQDVSDDDIPF